MSEKRPVRGIRAAKRQKSTRDTLSVPVATNGGDLAELDGLYSQIDDQHPDYQLILNGIVHECDSMLRQRAEDAELQPLNGRFHYIYADVLSKLAAVVSNGDETPLDYMNAAIERATTGLDAKDYRNELQGLVGCLYALRALYACSDKKYTAFDEDIAKALETLESFHTLKHGDEAAQYILGAALAKGDPETLQKTIDSLEKLANSNTESYHVPNALGEYYFEQAMDLVNDDEDQRDEDGRILEWLKKALSKLEAAYKVDKSDSKLIMTLAETALNLGNYVDETEDDEYYYSKSVAYFKEYESMTGKDCSEYYKDLENVD
ncbi:hypothetical protein CANCADRAFT_98250 [Tortispora caseinolytica NRRL Y-17796]|uniref:Enhancer of translation termination 1 n=1 Tax=Tortispora caseinolytica NRRL Y-17796 TaxID=767744 RepID=A0A1E4TE18_9ASCO|nr:hypothetical protein CANCADRAFT_98250 [Tortispora caseinolytica NRRL Y-17796]